MRTYKGFTLIELLVTLAIIATLAVIGFATFKIVLQNSRDAKRSTDLRLTQGALEQYRSDQLNYPNDGAADGGCVNGNLKFGCALKSPDGTKKYLNIVPVDSLGGSYKYCYKALKAGFDCDTTASSNCDNATANKCVSYCFYSQLENPPSSSGNYNCGSPAPTPGYRQKVAPP